MRFGVVHRKRPRHVYRRGEIAIFRLPNRHRDRFWTVVISLLVMVALATAINILSHQVSVDSDGRWTRLLVMFMVIPLMFIVLAITMPQRSIFISPRGLCLASTFRNRREWIKWNEIDAVRPCMKVLRVRSHTFFVPVNGLPHPARQELKDELKQWLEKRFDPSHRTVYWQYVARARTRWTVPWLLDRAALWSLALTFSAAQLAKCFCCSHPTVAFSILGVFVVAWMSFLKFHTKRMDRDNWIPQREAKSLR